MFLVDFLEGGGKASNLVEEFRVGRGNLHTYSQLSVARKEESFIDTNITVSNF